MAVTKEEVVEFIANMTVLELSEFIKELEEKFGVSAAAPAAAKIRPVKAGKGKGVYKFAIAISPLDCMGCSVCV